MTQDIIYNANITLTERVDFLEKRLKSLSDGLAVIMEGMAQVDAEALRLLKIGEAEDRENSYAWIPHKNGNGEFTELENLCILLQDHLKEPGDRYENHIYNYEVWANRNNILMVSRYERELKT